MGDLNTEYSTVTIHTDVFVLEKKDADTLMGILRGAEHYEESGWGDSKMYYIGGYATPDVKQGLISASTVMRGKLAGPKPVKES